ncbi:MAG: pilus assembly protein [Candidatus Andeanibacterium colombiense]|uniref:Pilus assembly protein n=1 Tax=Candidatus Andeanibacterium colombiense TaxID=3121345 RepID=A0AAJ5X6W9_9SPHN|nr:MAG: pilus assembly protein [Sphingomonadaceae bacterium]
MTFLRPLLRCKTAATAVEFAILAPIFFAMIFGIIEFSRYAWIHQTLNDVAYATARCMSVGTGCTSSTLQKTYAVNRAGGFGVTIAATNVTPVTNTTCKGYAASNSVTIRANFHSPVEGLIPAMPTQLVSIACFPVLA